MIRGKVDSPMLPIPGAHIGLAGFEMVGSEDSSAPPRGKVGAGSMSYPRAKHDNVAYLALEPFSSHACS